MLEFLMNNAATIIIGIILAGLAVLAVIKIIKDKKDGSGCASCSSCESCTFNKNSEEKEIKK